MTAKPEAKAPLDDYSFYLRYLQMMLETGRMTAQAVRAHFRRLGYNL